MPNSKENEVGHFALEKSTITGWFKAKTDQHSDFTIELRTSKRIFAYVRAFKALTSNEIKSDLVVRFSYKLSSKFVIEQDFPLQVKARIVEEDIDIPGSIEIDTINDILTKDDNSEIIGGFSGLRHGRLSGWVANSRNFDERLHITMTADNKPMYKAVASLFESELLQKQIGDGCYGFEFPVPLEILFENTTTIDIIIRDYDQSCPGFPKIIGLVDVSSLIDVVERQNSSILSKLAKINRHLAVDDAPDDHSIVSQLQHIYFNRCESMLEVYRGRTERAIGQLYKKIEALENKNR